MSYSDKIKRCNIWAGYVSGKGCRIVWVGVKINWPAGYTTKEQHSGDFCWSELQNTKEWLRLQIAENNPKQVEILNNTTQRIDVSWMWEINKDLIILHVWMQRYSHVACFKSSPSWAWMKCSLYLGKTRARLQKRWQLHTECMLL